MSSVPAEWRHALGGPLLTGWAANTSIASRHSVGPSMFTLDPDDLSGDAVTDPTIDTRVHMDFPYAGRQWLAPDALDTRKVSASPFWNHLSKARFGFIAPGTSTFVVVDNPGRVESGIGYKITQDDGNVCRGYCAYAADDESNAYWLFDVNDIRAAHDVHLPRPYASGSWSLPFDEDGLHPIIGGTFDSATSTLYLALGDAGQVGTSFPENAAERIERRRAADRREALSSVSRSRSTSARNSAILATTSCCACVNDNRFRNPAMCTTQTSWSFGNDDGAEVSPRRGRRQASRRSAHR